MALYKIIRKEIETTERIYEVEESTEADALRAYATNDWEHLFPQSVKTTRHTELIIENIL